MVEPTGNKRDIESKNRPTEDGDNVGTTLAQSTKTASTSSPLLSQGTHHCSSNDRPDKAKGRTDDDE